MNARRRSDPISESTDVPPIRSVSSGRASEGAPALSGPSGRRAALLLAASLPVAGFAVWYGFLEMTSRHPSLKLSGAMVLAGLGIAVLIAGRPSLSADTIHGHRHSALVAVHPVLFALASASMCAALIHFAVIQQHFLEYWLYGGFFIVVGLAQLVWAALALVRPFRVMLVAGALGNALVVLAWIVTRTHGSLVGPEATSKAMAGFGDIVSTLLEVVLVAGCVLVLVRPRFLSPQVDHRSELINGLIAIGLVLLTTLSLYSAVGGSPFVSHVG
jgi:hypothetical protein